MATSPLFAAVVLAQAKANRAYNRWTTSLHQSSPEEQERLYENVHAAEQGLHEAVHEWRCNVGALR